MLRNKPSFFPFPLKGPEIIRKIMLYIEGFVLCKKLRNEIYAYTLGKVFVYKFQNIKASVHA